MKALLATMKTTLQGLSCVREQDVYITASFELIPNGVRMPAVALKDGPIVRTELSGGMWERTLTVRIGLFAQVLKSEASIMGDAVSNQKGLLDLARDVHGLLDENLLSIAGMQAAFSPSETESETVGNETEMLQRKIVTYTYTQQEDRP